MIDLTSSKGKKNDAGFEPVKLTAPRIARTVVDRIAAKEFCRAPCAWVYSEIASYA